MTKVSGIRCSNCGHNGHNSRTCNEKLCFKLFGVKIVANKRDDSMKKSFSMGNLQGSNGTEPQGADDHHRGYLSDGPVRSRRDGHERKKGIPWTEEEHRAFLAGLEKLGKGDWKGISKQFVKTRTPTQVASHAQKHFLRQSVANKAKRRSSLFDTEIKDNGHNSKAAPSLPVNQDHDIQEQTVPPLASARGMLVASTTPMPTQWIPNCYGFPYMANPRAFPAVPYVQVLNYCNNGSYGVLTLPAQQT